MTRESFHESLEKIELQLLSMGELAGSAVQRAVEAIIERDEGKARGVIDADDQIDDLYLQIDQDILQLLALQSPVAADLRLISAMLHSNLHLRAHRRPGGEHRQALSRDERRAGERGYAATVGGDG